MIFVELDNLIKKALKSLSFEEVDFTIEHPSIITYGDLATNVAMVLSKKASLNPVVLAEKIKTEIEKEKPDFVEKIEVVKPGFINFFLSKKFLFNEIDKVIRLGDDFGKNTYLKDKNILIEHSSPNLFKPFHIGHFMNNSIGESVKRLMEYSGAKVETISYPSDISLGIGKAIFILIKDGYLFLDDEALSVSEKVKKLGDAYVKGVAWYDEHPEDQVKIRSLTEELYLGGSSLSNQVYQKSRKVNIIYFENITKRLGSVFDNYIFESEAAVLGKKIVKENTPKVFKTSEGATVFEGEEYGLHTRVFINKDDNPTYEAKDIGLLSLKFEKYNPDISIFVTDYQQGPYFEVVRYAGGLINKNWDEKTVHLKHGRMTFNGKKISSRLGGVPQVDDLLNAVIDEVNEKAPQLSFESKEQIAINSLKFAIVKNEAGKNVNFDPETSLSFEGDSGAYVLYTYARINSLLEKVKDLNIENQNNYSSDEISSLERFIYRFPFVINNAIKNYTPHQVALYLLNLCHVFNSYYAENKIIDEENLEKTKQRIVLVTAVKQIIKNGSYLLGMKTLDRM